MLTPRRECVLIGLAVSGAAAPLPGILETVIAIAWVLTSSSLYAVRTTKAVSQRTAR